MEIDRDGIIFSVLEDNVVDRRNVSRTKKGTWVLIPGICKAKGLCWCDSVMDIHGAHYKHNVLVSLWEGSRRVRVIGGDVMLEAGVE